MRFAFDAVFLGGGLRVVGVLEGLKPWRVGAARRAVSVHAPLPEAGRLVTGADVAAPRVLLVGADRRFRLVVAALLQRRGCTVTVGDEVSGTADVAVRQRVEVVVLDAGVLPALAALEAARLEALRPSVGMVLVSENPRQAARAAIVLPKWGSFDGLYGAIVSARAERLGAPGPAPVS